MWGGSGHLQKKFKEKTKLASQISGKWQWMMLYVKKKTQLPLQLPSHAKLHPFEQRRTYLILFARIWIILASRLENKWAVWPWMTSRKLHDWLKVLYSFFAHKNSFFRLIIFIHFLLPAVPYNGPFFPFSLLWSVYGPIDSFLRLIAIYSLLLAHSPPSHPSFSHFRVPRAISLTK